MIKKRTTVLFQETNMTKIRKWVAVASLCVLAASVGAATVDVAGVKLEDTSSVGNTALQLNGSGVRYKAIFKVYAAGLYLSKRAATPEEVMAAPGPKRMSITMLREIDSSELGKLFSRGIEDNLDKTAFSKIIPGVLRMSQVFSDYKKLQPGDNFMMDYIPGTGTIITVKGKVQGEPFKEPEFYNALLGIWLGKSPADYRLKDALLGKAPAP
jgi:hypothetical protein